MNEKLKQILDKLIDTVDETEWTMPEPDLVSTTINSFVIQISRHLPDWVEIHIYNRDNIVLDISIDDLDEGIDLLYALHTKVSCKCSITQKEIENKQTDEVCSSILSFLNK